MAQTDFSKMTAPLPQTLPTDLPKRIVLQSANTCPNCAGTGQRLIGFRRGAVSCKICGGSGKVDNLPDDPQTEAQKPDDLLDLRQALMDAGNALAEGAKRTQNLHAILSRELYDASLRAFSAAGRVKP